MSLEKDEKLCRFVDLQNCYQYDYWERFFPYSISLRLSPCGLGHSNEGETTVGGQKRRGEKRKVGQIGFGFFNVWEKSVFSARIFRSRNIIRRALPRAIFVCFGIKSANILVQSPGDYAAISQPANFTSPSSSPNPLFLSNPPPRRPVISQTPTKKRERGKEKGERC